MKKTMVKYTPFNGEQYLYRHNNGNTDVTKNYNHDIGSRGWECVMQTNGRVGELKVSSS